MNNINHIELNGIIGLDFTSKDVFDFLQNADGDINVFIHSPGGSVFEAIAIHNYFKNYNKGKKTIEIISLAASGASLITTAFNNVIVNQNSVFMLHNAWMFSSGDHNQLRSDANFIEKISNLLISSYMVKSNKSYSEIKKLMDDETYLFGQEIIDNGFADTLNEQIISIDKDELLNKTISEIELLKNKLQNTFDINEDILKAVAFLDERKFNFLDDSETEKLNFFQDDANINELPNSFEISLNNFSLNLLEIKNLINEINNSFKKFFDSTFVELIYNSNLLSNQKQLFHKFISEPTAQNLNNYLNSFSKSFLLEDFTKDLKNSSYPESEETFPFAQVDEKSRELHKQVLQIMKDQNCTYLSAINFLINKGA